MRKLLVLTDLHLCAPGQRIVGLDPAERLKSVLQAGLSAHPDVDALILMGDLTHHGDPAEYAVLRDVLADCPVPIVPMVGNHDQRNPFLAAFPDAPLTPTGHVQKVWDIGNHRVITLDSLDVPAVTGRMHRGYLCPARLTFLRDALATKGDRAALVCVHHPPFDTGIAGMDAIKLANGGDLLAVLAAFDDVHLLCGHMHRTISGTTQGVGWTVLKSPCHQGVLDFDSPNAHLSTNEPGAYGVVLLMPEGIVVHSEDVDVPGFAVFGGYDDGRRPA